MESRRGRDKMTSPPLPMWLAPLLLLFPLFFLMRHKIQTRNYGKDLPPSPPGLPIIGNLHQLGAIPHYTLWHLSKKYGSVMLLKLGSVPTVIISSSEAAKELFKYNDLNSCSRAFLASTGKLSYNFVDLAFTPYGDYWREMRKICVLELFSAKRVNSFRFVREEEVGLLIQSIRKSTTFSSPVDLSEMTLSLTANITCRTAFGKNLEDRGLSKERFQELIHEGFSVLGSFSASDFFPYMGWIVDRLTGDHSRLERSFKEFDVFYQEIIDDHMEKGKNNEKGHEDIIDVLLRLDQSWEFQISHDHIKAILMNIFMAGVDTGTITLVWAMAELVKNPRVMKKALAEIRTRIGNKTKVDESDIEKLDYLKMIIKETLRLHPPVTLLIPRETISQFSIMGYEIPYKTQIQVNVWSIGRDPNNWKNPENFFPERFIEKSIDLNGQNYEFLPFGSGRRVCAGILMGMAMVELALANLLFCFDWKLPNNLKEEDISMEEEVALTTYKKVPLVLLPVKYQP